MRRIDWHTPAAILEKIIRYEAVHEIQGWDDLRRRLDPTDRRCFAFFHPSLVDEPLVFVEVALMREMPGAIGEVLEEPHGEAMGKPPTTAVFYSISNCQEGLKGITFGNFLLKQVVEELAREVPSLKTLRDAVADAALCRLARAQSRRPQTRSPRVRKPPLASHEGRRAGPTAHREAAESAEIKAALLALAAHYFLRRQGRQTAARSIPSPASTSATAPGSSASTGWRTPSAKGVREAFGLMVNYGYDLKEIERNHEAYVNEGTVAASRAVRSLLKGRAKTKPAAPAEDRAGRARRHCRRPRPPSRHLEAGRA